MFKKLFKAPKKNYFIIFCWFDADISISVQYVQCIFPLHYYFLIFFSLLIIKTKQGFLLDHKKTQIEFLI